MGRWSCCVPLCTNFKRKGDNTISYHSFPSSEQYKKQWVTKIRRDEGVNFVITPFTKVCSQHFTTNDFRPHLHSSKKFLKVDAVPSIFKWTDHTKFSLSQDRMDRLATRNKNKRARKNEENNQNVRRVDDNVSVETTDDELTATMETHESVEFNIYQLYEDLQQKYRSLEVENCEIKRENEDLKKKVRNFEIIIDEQEKQLKSLELRSETLCKENDVLQKRVLCYKNIKTNDKMVNFYTGLPNNQTFQGFLEYFGEKFCNCVLWKGGETVSKRKSQSNKRGLDSKLTTEESLFLVFLRLKLALPVVDLARLFHISVSTVSRVVTTWINLLFHELKAIFKIPPLHIIRKTVPPQFKQYPDTTIIIDCTEFKIQIAFALRTQRETFSNYKHTNTLKALIGITPAGMVCFVSTLYGGSASDKHIVQHSGFLDLMYSGHCVMADKGFDIKSILPPGVKLNVPPKFRKSKTVQMPGVDVAVTRKIAKVRVHVERAIRRLKTFHILDHALPLTLFDTAEQIVAVCAYLTNYKPALLKPSVVA